MLLSRQKLFAKYRQVKYCTLAVEMNTHCRTGRLEKGKENLKMQISYTRSDFLTVKADILVIPVYEDWAKAKSVKALDTAFNGRLIKRARAAGFKGSEKSRFSLDAWQDAPFFRVLLVGQGERSAPSFEKLWDFSHKTVKDLRSPAVRTAALLVDFEPGPKAERTIAKLAQGALSGAYRFDRYKTDESKKGKKADLKRLVLIGFGAEAPAPKAARAAIERGTIIGEAVNLARDLVNEPAETMTPAIFAARSRREAAKCGITCKVETEDRIRLRKMGLFLAVARGGKNPPRLVTLTWNPPGAKGKPVVLVGKGLMYDSGGYSLKTSSGMETMKCDMSGSAAVLAAITALARLKVRRKVIAVVAACENMIGPDAYRVGDVFTSMSGRTVEVMNTDAEGRLTLADALTYAQSFKPELLIDLATLTGACVVALGEESVGVFPSDDDTAERLEKAFERAGEDFWRMPLNPRLKRLLKSDIADLKNVGGRWGGAVTAALFLREFVDEKVRWAHLDIAGPAFHKSEVGHLPKGGTGVGVTMLVELVGGGG